MDAERWNRSTPHDDPYGFICRFYLRTFPIWAVVDFLTAYVQGLLGLTLRRDENVRSAPSSAKPLDVQI